MKIEILGAGREVGGSGISIIDNATNIILDYGLKVNRKGPSSNPLHTQDISAIFLSHSHLDHCGSIPLLYKKEDPPFFTNQITLDTINLLIKDSFKIAKREKYPMSFGKNEVKKMNRFAKLLEYEESVIVDNFVCTMYDAGHIPGSAGILLEHSSGKKLFYTGDIKLEGSRLLNGCKLPKKVDVLITECTYGAKNHPGRDNEEKKILEQIDEALAAKETVLVPVFALGRSQEVLLILEKYADKIAFDGMAKAASEIVMQYGHYLKDPERLKKILNIVKWVQSPEERDLVLKQYPIIVATAAMMSGGPMLYYLRQLKDVPNTKILFVGFLVEDTPGRILLDTGFFKKAEEKYKVHCEIHQYDLSSHAGRDELFEIIRRINPKKVICVHGDDCETFAADVAREFPNIETYAPKNGDVIEI